MSVSGIETSDQKKAAVKGYFVVSSIKATSHDWGNRESVCFVDAPTVPTKTVENGAFL